MSLTKSKCWYSNNCLHFLKHAVPLEKVGVILVEFFIETSQTSILYIHKHTGFVGMLYSWVSEFDERRAQGIL